MRKLNKILMMTVAMLLTFVLISSCILSGTMAKFTVTKSADATATLEAFGVTLTVETPEGSGLSGSVDATTVKGGTGETGSLTYKLSDVSIKPGDDYFNAVRFSFDGAPTTDVKIRISVKFDLSTTTLNKFSVPSGIGGTTAQTWFMPLGFTFSSGKTSAEGNYALSPWKNDTNRDNMTYTDLAAAIRNNIRDKKITSPTYDASNSTSGHYYIDYKFGKDQPIQWTIGGVAGLKNFDMGFAWPDDSTHATYDLDVISTYIADQLDGATFGIIYTVSIEQV